MTHLLAAIFGLVIGSFVNVLIVRLPQKKSISCPGSECPGCGHAIRWYDNLPLLSYLWLRGKCRDCSTPISPRYPIVETLCALLFVAVECRGGPSWGVWARYWPFVAILLAVTFIDLEHRIIPDRLSLGGLLWALATSWVEPEPGVLACFGGAALGFGIFYSFSWLYFRSTGKLGLGGGDIKLLAMLGAFLGPSGVFTSILISSILGTLVGLAWAVSDKLGGRGRGPGESWRTIAIPYGPFLALGGLYHYLFTGFVWSPFTIPT